MPNLNHLLAASIALLPVSPLMAAPVNRSVVLSSLHYGSSTSGTGTGYQLSGHIAYQFQPGAAGEAGSVISIFINGVPLAWGGTGGTGGGTCGGTQSIRVGPGMMVGDSDGHPMYSCFLFCSNCVPPTGLCVPAGPAVTPISICICQSLCVAPPPPMTATAAPGSVNMAGRFVVEAPPPSLLPPGTLITVSIAAAPGTIPEVDLFDDTFTAQLSDLLRCGRADLGAQGGLNSADGLLDNNDFVAFIDSFFSGQPVADLGAQGGVPVPDGRFDNNDFVVFIDEFFAGCG